MSRIEFEKWLQEICRDASCRAALAAALSELQNQAASSKTYRQNLLAFLASPESDFHLQQFASLIRLLQFWPRS